MKRVPLEYIRIGKNVVIGCNVLVIMSLVYLYRSTTEDAEPIILQKVGKKDYRLVDGRHRFLASIIAGRQDILATYDCE